jgi:type I restriction enzyme M protein
MNETAVVQKVWNYAHVLRDAGVSAGEYVEQITCLLFLKMDDERSKGLGEPSVIPVEHRWESFRGLKGEGLAAVYTRALAELGRKEGLVGALFQKARNSIEDPASLQKLVNLIDDEEWLPLPVDVKGAIYEGLLERNAAEVKSCGAILHPAITDRCHCDRRRPAARQDRVRPRLRDRRLLAECLRAHETESARG